MKTNLTILSLAFILAVGGCTNNTSKEYFSIEIVKPDGTQIKMVYRPEMSQWSLLSFFEMLSMEHITPLSSSCIGEITAESSPESIESVGGLLGQALRIILK